MILPSCWRTKCLICFCSPSVFSAAIWIEFCRITYSPCLCATNVTGAIWQIFKTTHIFGLLLIRIPIIKLLLESCTALFRSGWCWIAIHIVPHPWPSWSESASAQMINEVHSSIPDEPIQVNTPVFFNRISGWPSARDRIEIPEAVVVQPGFRASAARIGWIAESQRRHSSNSPPEVTQIRGLRDHPTGQRTSSARSPPPIKIGLPLFPGSPMFRHRMVRVASLTEFIPNVRHGLRQDISWLTGTAPRGGQVLISTSWSWIRGRSGRSEVVTVRRFDSVNSASVFHGIRGAVSISFEHLFRAVCGGRGTPVASSY